MSVRGRSESFSAESVELKVTPFFNSAFVLCLSGDTALMLQQFLRQTALLHCLDFALWPETGSVHSWESVHVSSLFSVRTSGFSCRTTSEYFYSGFSEGFDVVCLHASVCLFVFSIIEGFGILPSIFNI